MAVLPRSNSKSTVACKGISVSEHVGFVIRTAIFRVQTWRDCCFSRCKLWLSFFLVNIGLTDSKKSSISKTSTRMPSISKLLETRFSVGINFVPSGQKSTASFPILLTYQGIQIYVPHNYWLDVFHQGLKEEKCFLREKTRNSWECFGCCVNEESLVWLMLLEYWWLERANSCFFATNITISRLSISSFSLTVA